MRSVANPGAKPKPGARRKTQGRAIEGTKSNSQPPGKSSRPSSAPAKPMEEPTDGNGSAATQHPEAHTGSAAPNSSPASHSSQTHNPDAGQNGNEAIVASDTQSSAASYAFLTLASETLEDIERVRIAAENRRRALTHSEQRIGLTEGDPHVVLADSIVESLREVEHGAELAVKRMLRDTPLGAWVKRTKGIGEKQAGRLLGVIGDPSIRVDGETGEVHERTVGQLWAYCGYSVVPAGGQTAHEAHTRAAPGVAPKRKRGEQGNWNPAARMRAYLIAENAMKAGVRKLDGCDDSDGYDLAHREAISPLGEVYLRGREKYADAKHKAPCPQCGPKGKPAEVGSDLSDGHKHARALRLVAKAVLKDMWIEARES